MLVDIQYQTDNATRITFKIADMDSIDDVVSIVGTITAGRYYFSAFSIYDVDFKDFIESLSPNAECWILVGLDDYGRPFIRWGDTFQMS